jgi:hypothetical protein
VREDASERERERRRYKNNYIVYKCTYAYTLLLLLLTASYCTVQYVWRIAIALQHGIVIPDTPPLSNYCRNDTHHSPICALFFTDTSDRRRAFTMTEPTKSDETTKNASSDADKTPEEVTAQPLIEAIEEDDEFEEFEPDNWNKADEDAEDVQQWQVSSV